MRTSQSVGFAVRLVDADVAAVFAAKIEG